MHVLKFGGSLCLFLFLLLTPHRALGQSAKKSVVKFTCSCEDAVGKSFAVALRTALAESKQFRELVKDEELDEEPIRINIVSLPIGENPDGQPRVAISIVSIHAGAVTHQLIETCDKITVENSAKNTLLELASWK